MPYYFFFPFDFLLPAVAVEPFDTTLSALEAPGEAVLLPLTLARTLFYQMLAQLQQINNAH